MHLWWWKRLDEWDLLHLPCLGYSEVVPTLTSNRKKKPTRRSPLTVHPSRQAGESLREHVYDRFILWWFYLAGWTSALIAVAVAAWFSDPRWLRFTLTFFAAVSTGVFAVTIRREWPVVINCLRGAKGERAVADVLEDLRIKGYRVLHDLPVVRDGKRVANIDHVLIGPAGVFAIETKYRSKPADRPGVRADIHWDGEKLLANGTPVQNSPLLQARNAADDLQRILGARLARDIPVRPVVLFPGWYVHESSGAEAWVLAPKRLFAWLTREAHEAESVRRLSEIAVERIAESLTAYCREAADRMKS
jgi:hypothetical protein